MANDGARREQSFQQPLMQLRRADLQAAPLLPTPLADTVLSLAPPLTVVCRQRPPATSPKAPAALPHFRVGPLLPSLPHCRTSSHLLLHDQLEAGVHEGLRLLGEHGALGIVQGL